MRASEAKLRSITASIPGVVYRMRAHPGTRKVVHDFVSDGVLDLAGIRPEEVLGDADEFIKLIHPEDLPRMEPAILHAATTGEPADVEYRLRDRDGTLKWVRGKLKLTGRTDDGWLVFDVFQVAD